MTKDEPEIYQENQSKMKTKHTMKTKLNLLAAGMFLAATSSALATVRYVNVNSAPVGGPI